MKDTLTQDSFTTRGRPTTSERRDGLVLFSLVFASCALLAFSRLELEPVHWLRWKLVAVTAPVLELAATPVRKVRQTGARLLIYFDALSEIERLRHENQRLRSFEWQAKELERKLAQVSALARLTNSIGQEFVTARVITDARGPFSNSVIINLGSRDGIRAGFAIVSNDGLVGHVVDVGDSAARVLLLSDPNSRIPVAIGPGTRAILTGDGAAAPRLTHIGLTQTASVAPMPAPLTSAATTSTGVRQGDDVATSGDDGVLPRGLRIGTVIVNDDGPRVRLASAMQGVDYLAVLMVAPPSVARGSDHGPLGPLAGETIVRGKLEPTSGRRGPGSPDWPSP